MKRKSFLAILMVLVMVLGGCGNEHTKETTNTDTESSSEVVNEETTEESVPVREDEVTVDSDTTDIDSLITEKTDEELDLKQFLYSYEDRTMDKEASCII